MIHTTDTTSSQVTRAAKSPQVFRSPHYDCRHGAKAMRLIIYVPGVTASGVDIAARAPDLTVTATKERFVRANWSAMQIERVQCDYRLQLRIGRGYDLAALTAEIENGVLTITLPKRAAGPVFAAGRLARAA